MPVDALLRSLNGRHWSIGGVILLTALSLITFLCALCPRLPVLIRHLGYGRFINIG